MRHGIQWCPHCSEPHKLTDKYCRATGKSLERTVHRPSASEIVARLSRHRLIGTFIDGKYEIIRRIGVGGMGEVFEAHNRLLSRPVAIKIVARTTPEAIERLRREARVIASIQHPNICDVYDVGNMPDGCPYLVLERLNGETLNDLLRRERRLSASRAIGIFEQILSGLQHAHAAGILHRDLKPANVFLVERVGLPPLVKLLDFGFAKEISGRAIKVTRPGNTCGTPGYMSPEQLEARELDYRSDIFSVGIMLFEALGGAHPFYANTLAEVCSRIMYEPFTDLRQLRPQLPVELTNIVHLALDKVRDLRPQSAFAMQHALTEINSEMEDEASSTTSSNSSGGRADSITMPRLKSDSSPLTY
jgi:eukaryotic-like serine/threonine-protein kinase